MSAIQTHTKLILMQMAAIGMHVNSCLL